MDAVFYWDMTYREIMAAIEGNQARMQVAVQQKREELRFQAVIAYRQSDLLATLVSRVFGGNARVPNLDEIFPGMFPELEQAKQQNWQLMKARIEQFAAERRKRGEKNGSDNAGRASSPDHSGNERVTEGTEGRQSGTE